MSITKNKNVVSEYDNCTYQGSDIVMGKTKWNVVTRTSPVGILKSVTIRKMYPNPWKTLGKDFKNFNEAVDNYKNSTMKMNLRLIECGLY